jgi:hypothetical protein
MRVEEGAMREQREPWLRLPAKETGSDERPRLNPRFRTHVVAIPRASTAAPVLPAEPPMALSPQPKEPELEPTLSTEPAPPTPVAIERAAAAAAIAARPPIRVVHRKVETETPRPAPKPVETRAAAAPAMDLDDLSPVSSADWVVKVGEAAKMVDVVVVFYTVAYCRSEMFEYAFRTVVNQVLPQAGRPYAVYRFSLDDEPDFVPEMTTSLGLPTDNPVTSAGFAWSGPGRRLFLLGDRALESQAVFQRSLRRGLSGQPAVHSQASAARRQPAASLERHRRGAARPWGGRALAVLAWCLFGTAALGAAVVGVAPQWTSSLLHPASVPGPGSTPDNPPPPGSAQTGALPPAVSPDKTAMAPAAVAGSPAKPVKHVRRKPTPSLSLNPTYWGLPSEGRSR